MKPLSVEMVCSKFEAALVIRMTCLHLCGCVLITLMNSQLAEKSTLKGPSQMYIS